MKFVTIKFVLFVLIMLLAACGTAAVETGSNSTEPKVMVMDAWSRQAASGGNGAVYFHLMNEGGADTLIGAETDIANAVELHETKMDDNDVMQMSPISNVEITSGGSVDFEPGGKHIMLMGLKEDLVPGQEFEVTLNFEQSGAVVIKSKVQEGANDHNHDDHSGHDDSKSDEGHMDHHNEDEMEHDMDHTEDME